MKVFVKYVWAFIPDKWPIVAFSKPGHRLKLLRESNPGDLVVFIGANNSNTPREEDRGRLLAIVEFGRKEIDTLDVLKQEDIRSENDLNEQGEFKWPQALAITRAWRFTDDPLPLIKDIIAEKLPANSISQAIELNDADSQSVLSLAKEEVALPQNEVIEKIARTNKRLSQNNATKGPVPSASSKGGQRSLGNPAFTYAFRFEDSNYWKIGYTGDIDKRLKEVNKHIPVDLLKQSWKHNLKQGSPSETDAYNMEQRVLELLIKYRKQGEMVECSETILLSAWAKAIEL